MEDCLKHYLECESILHEFFIKACNNCFSSNKERRCCTGSWYNPVPGNNGERFLDKERIKLYGLPKRRNGRTGCGYHSSNGCILETHKSPVCLSMVCFKLEDFLHSAGINYNPREIYLSLSNILEGKVKNEELDSFKSRLKCFVNQLKNISGLQ